MPQTKKPLNKIHWLILASGLAALSWEVIWQILSSLALGVSAWGTALTLAVTMGGMSLGAILMGVSLRAQKQVRPLRLYALLEFIIALCGFLIIPAFKYVEKIDTAAFASGQNTEITFLYSIAACLILPAMSMGATLPLFGLAARQFDTTLSRLYGLNTLGAAAGTLFCAFAFIPFLGVTQVTYVIATLNVIIGIIALIFDRNKTPIATAQPSTAQNNGTIAPLKFHLACFIVCVTGFATFALEVAWFRALTSAFRSTTMAFAVMLSCVLIALGLGAALVPFFRQRKYDLGVILAGAGILILAITPIIERFDLIAIPGHIYPSFIIFKWFISTLYVLTTPILLLGAALPWIMDSERTPAKWGTLYSLNALFAIAGALCAGWILLPAFGFTHTAWIAGGLVLSAGLLISLPAYRLRLAACGLGAIFIAVLFDSGTGKTRIMGWQHGNNTPTKIVETREGPDATVSVVEYEGGYRALIINGFAASSQASNGISYEHYMLWMGHLPMLLSENPKNTLVICFGTGQTAHTVRSEKPDRLDIVDINENVFKMAPHFSSNHGVLNDQRVTPIVMDGRAYMRRTNKIYDVITLEPMPPSFAGVNALYSDEFYQQAREKMSDKGVIAQWLPFHLMSTHSAASITKTFIDVFPNAFMWIDPKSTTAILVGMKQDSPRIGTTWPGFARNKMARSLSQKDILKSVLLEGDALRRYASNGQTITDDNQFLAYGAAVYESHRFPYTQLENMDVLKKFAPQVQEFIDTFNNSLENKVKSEP